MRMHFGAKAASAVTGFGLVAGLLVAAPSAAALPAPTPAAYYKNCQEARDAGVAPLRRGDDGYRPGLDRDGEWDRMRRWFANNTHASPRAPSAASTSATAPTEAQEATVEAEPVELGFSGVVLVGNVRSPQISFYTQQRRARCRPPQLHLTPGFGSGVPPSLSPRCTYSSAASLVSCSGSSRTCQPGLNTRAGSPATDLGRMRSRRSECQIPPCRTR